MDKNLIVGIHAIRAAIANPKRRDFELFMTHEGQKTLATPGHIQQTILGKHDFQERCKQLHRQLDFEYQKTPGGAILLCSAIPIETPNNLYSACTSPIKIIVLDGITDVHNAGAIARTASFYNANTMLVGGKSFGLSPAFFRIASGGAEHLTIIQATNLPKTVRGLQERGVTAIALSEEGEQATPEPLSKIAIVLGAEDRGISHALMMQCSQKYSLGGRSLNVSVAAAIAMERLFDFRHKTC